MDNPDVFPEPPAVQSDPVVHVFSAEQEAYIAERISEGIAAALQGLADAGQLLPRIKGR